MLDRRHFLESLAGLTATLLVTGRGQGDEPGDAARDRLGELLPQRLLGRTGEAVTMLGVGGWHIGRMNERDAQETLEAALEGGVRFFDSAESYQDGVSEQYFGRFLTPRYRDEVYVMSKTTARDADGARRHLDESLRRLKTDHLDLWQVHAVESAEDVDQRIGQGVFDVVRQAQQAGKTRHIGFTGHTRYGAHLRVLERSDMFDTCQMPINVADPSYESFIEHVLPRLAEQRIGTLAMKTLANGGFFGGRRQGEHGPHPRVTPDRISIQEALHFAWSLPISVLITGPDNLDQMKEKIGLARQFRGMTAGQRKRLIEKVADMAGRGVEFYKA